MCIRDRNLCDTVQPVIDIGGLSSGPVGNGGQVIIQIIAVADALPIRVDDGGQAVAPIILIGHGLAAAVGDRGDPAQAIPGIGALPACRCV